MEGIPREFQNWFSAFQGKFNRIQEACKPVLLHSEANVVVCAPTGCGKTVLLDLAMIRALTSKNKNHRQVIVYLAPTKALCSERAVDWTNKAAGKPLKVHLLLKSCRL